MGGGWPLVEVEVPSVLVCAVLAAFGALKGLNSDCIFALFMVNCGQSKDFLEPWQQVRRTGGRNRILKILIFFRNHVLQTPM